MKKLVCVLMALTFAFTSTLALAGKPVDEVKLPETIGIIVQMPDGSVQVIYLPKESEGVLDRALLDPDGLELLSEKVSKNFEDVSIIYIPPVFIWQLGWFTYSNMLFFGYRGPNGIYWIYYNNYWYFWDANAWVPCDYLC